MEFDAGGYGLIPVPPYPQCNLTYNTMVVLKLKSCFEVMIPDSVVSFPCLKTLHFTRWYPYHSDLVDWLIYSCPVLEVLHLEGYLQSDENLLFDISIPTLETLYLNFNNYDRGFYEHYLVINTPHLKYLDIQGRALPWYIVKDLDPGLSVHVDYPRWLDIGHSVNFDLVSRLFVLLKHTDKAKHLSLSPDCIIILQSLECCHWPKFPNLTSLELCARASFDWTSLGYFLEKSPNLECISLYKELDCKEYAFEDRFKWNPPKDVPDCLKLTLRQVDFSFFKGRKDELDLVEYLLNNAQVLEIMLVTTFCYPLDDEMVEKIEMFHRALENCEVHVCNHIKRKVDESFFEAICD